MGRHRAPESNGPDGIRTSDDFGWVREGLEEWIKYCIHQVVDNFPYNHQPAAEEVAAIVADHIIGQTGKMTQQMIETTKLFYGVKE